jgi:uncharacterized protein YgiM (DUF1202 family)
MDKNKKTTLEELMGKSPSEEAAVTPIEEKEPPKPQKQPKEKKKEENNTDFHFDLPAKKSKAGLFAIFILLFLIGGVAYYFYFMYTKTQDNTAKTNEQKIVNSTELEEKQKQEETAEETPAPQTTAPDVTTKTYYATAEMGLNIRSSASTEAEVAGSIPYGEKVTPTSDDGTWVGVSFSGVNGFVKKEFLTETAPPALN